MEPIRKANEARALVHYRNASESPSLLSKHGMKSGTLVVEPEAFEDDAGGDSRSILSPKEKETHSGLCVLKELEKRACGLR